MRNDSVFPEPVWDWINASRHEDAPGDRRVESDARCIDVGFRMFIFVVRCVAIRGLRPSPVKVEESVSGALLGLLGACNTDAVDFGSTFGLEENSEDIICVGWRGLGCASGTERDATDRGSERLRGRLGGRSSTMFAFAWE
jgi:hypothetical protein